MIHKTAIVHPEARIGEGVTIGPYSIIGPRVEIGAGTWIGPHVVIQGPARIGRRNRIFPFASLGGEPQDKKYQGEESWLWVGDDNVIREYCTFNRGTALGGGVTRVGNHNWIMAYVHIAHDCQVGDHTVFANGASLAGHVQVEDYAVLGGFTLVSQFCTLGAHCFCAMGSAINKDVPPYVLVAGHMARPVGINSEGLRRRGFAPATIDCLRRAFRLLYRAGLRQQEALALLEGLAAECPEVGALAAFVRRSRQGIIR